MQDRLFHFIILEVPGSEINKSILFYLRIACALRDPTFSSWIVDKNPLFSSNVCLGASSLDSCLGLDLWVPLFERHLNIFGSVFRRLRNLPERVSPQLRGMATADEWKLLMSAWNSWLHNRAADHQADYEIVNPSILALSAIAVSKDLMRHYSHTSSTLTAKNANQCLRQALVMAQEIIARHTTVDEIELSGFHVNDYDSFPWDLRTDEDTDETLFNLIATRDLFAEEENLDYSWWMIAIFFPRDTSGSDANVNRAST